MEFLYPLPSIAMRSGFTSDSVYHQIHGVITRSYLITPAVSGAP